VIEFIRKHSINKQKAYAELKVDLSKFSKLLNCNYATDKLDQLPLKWYDFTRQNLHQQFYNVIEELSCADANLQMFDDREKNSAGGPTVADFFSGCGGLSEGFTQSGYSIVFANEIEQTFAETFYINHKTAVDGIHVGDIEELHTKHKHKLEQLRNVDVVCGGPPCQGFSTANRQRLIDDPRNHLYRDYLNVLSIIRPKFFLIENVIGMAKRLDDIKEDISTYLGDDYKFATDFLSAPDFGVPQKRKRFILIANRVGVNPSDIFSTISHSHKTYALKHALQGLPKLGPKKIKNASTLENETIGYKITKTGDDKSNDYISHINNNAKLQFIFNHKNRYNNDRDIEIFGRMPQGANSLHHSIADIMPYAGRNHMFKDKYFKLNENERCKTITSHMKFDCNMYIHPNQARGLSPREAARIQSFPDNYFLRGTHNAWYQQIGNAVPVKMSRAIAGSIKQYL